MDALAELERYVASLDAAQKSELESPANPMTTVFLRATTPPASDDITPLVPTLADIGQRISARHYAIALDPILVDPSIYEKAEKEMTMLMDRRGFIRHDPRGNVVLIQRAEMPERNFLLMGVPVVCRE